MKKINILCAAIICGFAISACNGGEKPQAASEAETSTTDLNKLEQGLTWDNLRQVLNKTPVEAGLYSVSTRSRPKAAGPRSRNCCR